MLLDLEAPSRGDGAPIQDGRPGPRGLGDLENYEADRKLVKKSSEEDRYLVFSQSLNGEKQVDGEPYSDCPSLRGLDDELIFRIRDITSINLVFINIYDTLKSERLYVHFIRKFIFLKVIAWYWQPVNYLMVMLTLLSLFLIVGYISHLVIQPLREMCQMTEYIMNPDRSHLLMKGKARKFQRVIKKVQVLEHRLLIRLEEDKLEGAETTRKLSVTRQESYMVEIKVDQAQRTNESKDCTTRGLALKNKKLILQQLPFLDLGRNNDEVNEIESLLNIFARYFLHSSQLAFEQKKLKPIRVILSGHPKVLNPMHSIS